MVLLGLTAVLVAAAYAQVATILPPYANEHAGVSPAGIGVVFFVNTIVLVIAQLPIAKALEGRRRFPALVLTAALFAVTCATILVVGRLLHGSAAVVALCGVIVVFSLAECIHGAVNNPLIADLAPPELMGRYMGLRTSAFQLGYLAGPTLGSLMLATSTSGLWLRRRLPGRVGGLPHARPPGAVRHRRDTRRSEGSAAGVPGTMANLRHDDRRPTQYRCPACPASGARRHARPYGRLFHRLSRGSRSSPLTA